MTPQDILYFWFSELTPKDWFNGGSDLDYRLTRDFFNIHDRASKGELFHWRSTLEGRLAEIIILDQFSRNIHRGTPKAFASDPMALTLAQEVVALGFDQKLDPVRKAFLYLPYMHSESQTIHEIAVELYSQPGLEKHLEFEHKHKVIVDKFGRYPHRNDVLGRTSSPEEIAFLKTPGSSF